jgi:Uma2 family endonuclease
MSTKTRLITADEFLLMPDNHMRDELIRGEVISMPLPGGRHGKVAMNISLLLGSHTKANNLGDLFAAETGYLIERNPDTVRGADVSFIRRERLDQIVNWDKHIPFAPDLAVEIVSPSDGARKVADKAAVWLAAGSLMVWNVFSKTRTITVYRPGAEPLTLTEDEVLDGGDVVPGFRCRVGDIFA